MKRITLLLGAIFAIVFAVNVRVNAANIVVTTNADAGAGSLRAAIINANAGDKITFNLSAGNETITIDSMLPAITKTLTIDGSNTAGSGIAVTVQVTIPGNSPFRVFCIADSLGIDTIENMKIKGGDISSLTELASFGGGILVQTGTLNLINSTVSGSIASQGGGIYNYSNLIIKLSTVNGDSAGYGGGIYNEQSNSTIVSSNITGNRAGDGGGIYNYDYGGNITHTLLTIDSSTISGNRASDAGGGIYNMDSLIISSSIISGNTALGDNGGGIYNDGNQGAYLTITSSTISECKAIYGGGIYNDGGGAYGSFAYLTILSSTINNNQAIAGPFVSGGSKGGGICNLGDEGNTFLTITSSTISLNNAFNGGGFYGDSGGGFAQLTITSSTISENNATADGGGIYIAQSLNLLNTIIINNTAITSGGDIYAFSGCNAYYCWYNKTSGIINTETTAPNDTTPYKKGYLDTLQINSPGTTATMATLAGCPAIGRGTFAYYNATYGYYFLDSNNVSHNLYDWRESDTINPSEKITTDQRGVFRFSPATIGAYQGKNCINTTGDTTATACKNFTWYGTTYTASGTPTHVLIKSTGCDSTVTLNLTIMDCNGVNELGIMNYELGIYPNPVSNGVTIETSSVSSFNINLISIFGESIYNTILSKKAVIDMSNLSNGMYLIRIYNENGTVVKKIIKQ